MFLTGTAYLPKPPSKKQFLKWPNSSSIPPLHRTQSQHCLTSCREGKIKHIGISECSASDLRRAHAIHPVSAVQVEYSPFSLDIERPEIDLLATARELGVSIVAYSPLGRGMLTGAIKSPSDLEENDFRRMLPRFSPENFGANLKLVDAIKDLASRKGATSGQVALAWLMAQGDDVIPIPGYIPFLTPPAIILTNDM